MLNPRVKSVFPPLPLDDKTIRIGGADFGIAAEIADDEERHLWQLLQLLDGSRSRRQICDEMRRIDPRLSDADIEAAVEQLTEAGYLEDAAIAVPAEFTAGELERYRRNVEFFGYFNVPGVTGYDFQLRLRRSRVTVLGIGGLGSYVALALAAAGVGDLLLVDDDRVEPHNLNRQVLYTEADIGWPKTEAAAQRLAQVNPHVAITAKRERVSSVDNARDCMRGRDLLVCAADRPRVQIYNWINEAAMVEGVAWLRGANDGLTVNMFLHVPGQTACFACDQRRAHANIPGYAAMLRHAMQEVGDRTVNPCTAPISGLIGSIAALEVVKFLSGAMPPSALNRKLIFDLQTMQIRFRDGMRYEDCDMCREKAPAVS